MIFFVFFFRKSKILIELHLQSGRKRAKKPSKQCKCASVCGLCYFSSSQNNVHWTKVKKKKKRTEKWFSSTTGCNLKRNNVNEKRFWVRRGVCARERVLKIYIYRKRIFADYKKKRWMDIFKCVVRKHSRREERETPARTLTQAQDTAKKIK